MRGETEDIEIAGEPPFRWGDLAGKGREVDICKAAGMGILFRGIVSRRYGCSRHCRLVSRDSGSYLRRSAMHSISLMGTERSNNE